MEIIVDTKPFDSCYSIENEIWGVCVRNGPWTLKKKENQHAKIAKWAKSLCSGEIFIHFKEKKVLENYRSYKVNIPRESLGHRVHRGKGFPDIHQETADSG